MSAFSDSKPHYELLDGLRGVAALLVLWYHVHEGFAFASGAPVIECINHGYLAVDFFFILSGFVIGYAYGDRLGSSMTIPQFFRRRLIRLHPMVIMGAVTGVAFFIMQGGVKWDGSHVATSSVMTALLCAMLFIPAFPGSGIDIRGNGEAFSLNGPAWSLFFEYIGNIIFALFIRRLSTKSLAVLTAVLAVCTASVTSLDMSGYGMFGVGWTMHGAGFFHGMLRMMFPFTMGILLSRVFRPLKIKGAFWICSAILAALLFMPAIESGGRICLNGVYESFCIILMFPLLVWLGASGSVTGNASSRICRFLGDISYPLYITHYPAMYLFYAWMIDTQLFTWADTWQTVVVLLVWNVGFAYLCLRLYDAPVRQRLARRLVPKQA